MITRNIKVTIDMEYVLRKIDCYEDSPIYKEVIEEYNEILEKMYSLCEPVFLMEKSVLGSELAEEGLPEGTEVFMVIYSIGKGISDYSTTSFAKGDYLKGILADAMADSALFSMEKEFEPLLKEACANHQRGISKRLEAPSDISVKFQKVVWETTRAQELCGIGITSGYMLNPVKSNSILYVLTEEKEIFRHQHDCRKCKNYHCKMRNVSDVPVKVKDGKKTYSLMVKEKESILDALMAVESSYTSVCGGTGKCDKCKIRIIEGSLPITSFDERCFSKDKLETGLRLACKAYPTEPLTIELNFKGEADFMVVTDYAKSAEPVKIKTDSKDVYGIAVDIGTTTIAIQLLNLQSGENILTHTTINHQRNFGADVISRIKASVEGKKEELQNSIRKDLNEGIRYVVSQSGVPKEKVTEVAIAGNTTMTHLLMGYECKSLGEYPFTPVNIELIESSYEKIVGNTFLNARVRVLPGISTFVGGDIVSGLYSCNVDEKESYSLLIDLGTNGELALGNKEELMTTSTAAGPAFEGGNIEWGVGSIQGAITGVRITEEGPVICTIGDKEPTGICGTGVIEMVAELIRTELVDETGCLDDDYFSDGYPLAKTADGDEIVFTQQDIREIQLAKAAVRAGIETLVLRYGIEKDEITQVYLAGGFGFKLDCQKAIEIGMIPEEFAGKIEAVGNSSLGGAVKCLLSEDGWERISAMGSGAKEINLSADKDFNEFYMEYMYFERG